MLIALLALLGIDLSVVLGLLVTVVLRRRWVRRRPGVFAGAVHVVDGTVEGLSPKWTRGYGRWVGSVLVWTTRPFLLRNVLVALDGPGGTPRPAGPDEVKRLGEEPVVVTLQARGRGRLEVAARHDGAALALGPFAPRAAARTEQRDPAAVG